MADKEISYYAFETKMRQLVLGLLKPVNDADLQNQERFQELRDYRFKIDKQLVTLEQTVFEKGEGVQIFDLLKRDIKELNKARKENEKTMEQRLKLLDQKLLETNEKLRKLDEYGQLTKVGVDDLKYQLEQAERTQTREFDTLDARMERLSEWLRRDTDKLFESMDKVQRTADECTSKVSGLAHVVGELRAREDRNDEFMKSLLQKSENMELCKVETQRYEDDWEGMQKRFIEMENYNKANHIHYVQIENFVEKYLPLKQQKAIGKTILSLFEGKSGAHIQEKYQAYEERYLKEANRRILADDGQPRILQQTQVEFIQMLAGALMIKEDIEVEKDSPTEHLGAGGGLEPEMASREAKEVNVDELYDKAGKLMAMSAENEPTWINLNDYVLLEAKKSAKLMPDLDFDKVSLDRKRQFNEFVKLYSAIEQEQTHRRAVAKQCSTMSQRPSVPRKEGSKKSRLDVVQEGSASAASSKQQLLNLHQRGSKASLGSNNNNSMLGHEGHTHKEKDDSEDDLGLGGPNWAKEIAPYVDAKYEQAFSVYQEWQKDQIKEFSSMYDAKAADMRNEFKMRLEAIEEHFVFLQGETHNLLQFQLMMKDCGLMSDKGSVNNDFLADLRQNNVLLKDVNQLHVLSTSFQLEMVKYLKETGQQFSHIHDQQVQVHRIQQVLLDLVEVSSQQNEEGNSQGAKADYEGLMRTYVIKKSLQKHGFKFRDEAIRTPPMALQSKKLDLVERRSASPNKPAQSPDLDQSWQHKSTVYGAPEYERFTEHTLLDTSIPVNKAQASATAFDDEAKHTTDYKANDDLSPKIIEAVAISRHRSSAAKRSASKTNLHRFDNQLMLLQQLSYLSYELIDQRATTKLQYEKISKVLDNYRDHDPIVETRPSAKARRANQSKSVSNAVGMLESAKAQQKVFNANQLLAYGKANISSNTKNVNHQNTFGRAKKSEHWQKQAGFFGVHTQHLHVLADGAGDRRLDTSDQEGRAHLHVDLKASEEPTNQITPLNAGATRSDYFSVGKQASALGGDRFKAVNASNLMFPQLPGGSPRTKDGFNKTQGVAFPKSMRQAKHQQHSSQYGFNNTQQSNKQNGARNQQAYARVAESASALAPGARAGREPVKFTVMGVPQRLRSKDATLSTKQLTAQAPTPGKVLTSPVQSDHLRSGLNQLKEAKNRRYQNQGALNSMLKQSKQAVVAADVAHDDVSPAFTDRAGLVQGPSLDDPTRRVLHERTTARDQGGKMIIDVHSDQFSGRAGLPQARPSQGATAGPVSPRAQMSNEPASAMSTGANAGRGDGMN